MPEKAAQGIVSGTIATCESAAYACEQAVTWCLQAREPALGRVVLLALDCGEICRLTAALVTRGSTVAESACQLCAEICDLCAAECRRHRSLHTDITADRCHRAALACRRMLQPMLQPAPRAAAATERTGVELEEGAPAPTTWPRH